MEPVYEIDDNIHLEDSEDELTEKLDYLAEGSRFIISGKLLPKSRGFAIEFCTNDNNKALRVSVLINKNLIGRNFQVNQVWGSEETETELPFYLKANQNIQMEIFITKEAFLIALNGFHVAEYKHRLPYKSINIIMIQGCIANVRLNQDIAATYPKRPDKTFHIEQLANRSNKELTNNEEDMATEEGEVDAADDDEDDEDVFDKETFTICGLEWSNETYLPLPYYGTFKTSFFKTRYTLQVKGRVRPKPQQLEVNLQKGSQTWPSPLKILTVKILFIRIGLSPPRLSIDKDGNEKGDEGGGTCSRDQCEFELPSKVAESLQPGSIFNLEIIRKLKSFEIYVNNIFVKKTPYTLHPKLADTVFINGDIKLFDIEIISD